MVVTLIVNDLVRGVFNMPAMVRASRQHCDKAGLHAQGTWTPGFSENSPM
jgi:hypothetical protein